MRRRKRLLSGRLLNRRRGEPGVLRLQTLFLRPSDKALGLLSIQLPWVEVLRFV